MPPDLRDADDDAPDDYTDATSTFGDRLGLAREAMGLSQAELAERIGVKAATLRNWEEDRAEPRANKLQMLAGLLNAPMIWLMSGQGEAPAREQAAGPPPAATAPHGPASPNCVACAPTSRGSSSAWPASRSACARRSSRRG